MADGVVGGRKCWSGSAIWGWIWLYQILDDNGLNGIMYYTTKQSRAVTGRVICKYRRINLRSDVTFGVVNQAFVTAFVSGTGDARTDGQLFVNPCALTAAKPGHCDRLFGVPVPGSTMTSLQFKATLGQKQGPEAKGHGLYRVAPPSCFMSIHDPVILTGKLEHMLTSALPRGGHSTHMQATYPA
jgi:hypothetical protein